MCLIPRISFRLNPSGPFRPSGVSDSFELTVVLPSGFLRMSDPVSFSRSPRSSHAPQGASLERLCILIDRRLFVNLVSPIFLNLFWFFCSPKTKRGCFLKMFGFLPFCGLWRRASFVFYYFRSFRSRLFSAGRAASLHAIGIMVQ